MESIGCLGSGSEILGSTCAAKENCGAWGCYCVSNGDGDVWEIIAATFASLASAKGHMAEPARGLAVGT